MKILGLDLGTNSIGYAVIDSEDQCILDMNVRIFPEGVNRDKGREVSKNETRRNARQGRRQIFRRRLRRDLLIQVLKEHLLMPNSKELIQDWVRLNPYQLRAKALTEALELEEIGRVFYHFSQRRGFLSNRKSKASESGKIFDGDAKINKIGINDTLSKIEENNCLTLGQYLNEIHPKKGEIFQLKERVLNRYTTRQMYIDEFELIWRRQVDFHPQALTTDLYKKIGPKNKDMKQDGILFYQRPLKSQSFLIGKCSLEKNKKRCPISMIEFEEFRAWQFVNTIEYGEAYKLDEVQRQAVVDLINSRDKNFDLKPIKKKLSLESEQFNYADDERNIPGNYTISRLSKLFGVKIWNLFSMKEKNDIWNVIYTATSDDWLNSYAVEKWGFNEKQLAGLEKIHFKDDYSSLSLKAIRNILPFLKEGYVYSDAVCLGGVKNVFGEAWNEFSNEQQTFIIDTVNDIISADNREGERNEKIKDFLFTEYSISESRLNKLYHHSQKEIGEIQDKLGLPPQIRNPLVQQVLFEVKKLVNFLLGKHGPFGQIKVELGRELKSSKEDRLKANSRNRNREAERKNAIDRLEANGIKPNQKNIEKYLLWEECGSTSPYSLNQNKISFTDLFSDQNLFQVEHIIPWSVSLDNSFANKSICEAAINSDKGNKTPFEYFGRSEIWNDLASQAFKLLPYNKAKKFVNEKTPDADGFIERQLNDTRYISKETVDYLKEVCADVQGYPGTLTAFLRKLWGLNSILQKELGKKNRDDHRHHAIDALVIAVANRSIFHQLSNYKVIQDDNKLRFPFPWEGFREDAQEQVLSILISHRKVNRSLTPISKWVFKDGKKFKSNGIAARGQLHKESVYGKRQINNESGFHIRKPVDSLELASVKKIVDPNIRNLFIQRLIELNIELEKGKVPPNAFVEIKEDGTKEYKIFLPNKNGDKVPIKKVRIRESIGNAVPLKDDSQWVNPKNNHHVAIYANSNGDYKEETRSLWEVIERKRNELPFMEDQSLDGWHFEFSMEINDMFILGLQDDEINWDYSNLEYISPYLYRVQTISLGDYRFRQHLAATIIHKEELLRISSLRRLKELNPIKVKVNLDGTLKRL